MKLLIDSLILGEVKLLNLIVKTGIVMIGEEEGLPFCARSESAASPLSKLLLGNSKITSLTIWATVCLMSKLRACVALNLGLLTGHVMKTYARWRRGKERDRSMFSNLCDSSAT